MRFNPTRDSTAEDANQQCDPTDGWADDPKPAQGKDGKANRQNLASEPSLF